MPVWKPLAVADRKGIAKYIARDNPLAAVELVDLLIRQASSLDANPNMGRPGRIENTREWVVHPNYVIVYRVEEGSMEPIVILRVLHASQAWPA
jgi:toxin ParE1/3/4